MRLKDMGSKRFWPYAVVLLALAACATTVRDDATTLPSNPKQLAQEQWENCSHFPSVEFIEISPTGELIVREKHGSGLPTKYLRCVSSVSYKQVLSGRRDARDVIHRAYFTKERPPSGTLAEVSGHSPSSVKQFELGQEVTFFYVLAGLDEQIAVTLIWYGPQGEYARTKQLVGPTGPSHQRSWRVDQIVLPQDQPGLWLVSMFIENRPAGDYQFKVPDHNA